MTHRTGRTAISIATVLVMLSPAAGLRAAEGAERSSRDRSEIYMGGRIAWLEVEDVEEGDLNFGVFGGIRVTRHVAINAAIDYHNAEWDLERRETFALTASLEAYPMKRKVAVQPYVLGGVGFYESNFELTDCCGNVIVDDTEYEFGFHAGGGLDVVLRRKGNERLALNVEVRRLFTDEEDEDDQVEPDGTLIGLGLKVKIGS